MYAIRIYYGKFLGPIEFSGYRGHMGRCEIADHFADLVVVIFKVQRVIHWNVRVRAFGLRRDEII